MDGFNALKLGLTITNIKGDLRHRNDHAMGHVPKGFSRWATASSYLYDIERILLELEMSRSFVEKIPDEQILCIHSINPEDYIMYHQGYFLDLIHQLKDKLIQLLYAIIVADREYSSKIERHVDLNKLKKGKLTERISGLKELLEVWNADLAQDPSRIKNPITIALQKRTNYHHHKNPLTSEQSYFQAKSHRSLLSPEMSIHLSEYGKQMIAERGKKNVETWRTDSLRKITDTLNAVRENVDIISNLVLKYFKMPLVPGRGRQIMLQFVPLEQSVTIPSCSRTLQDVSGMFRELFNMIYTRAVEVLPEDESVSVYAIGSTTRKSDFIFGVSDINVVIVVKSDNEESKGLMRSFILNPPIPIRLPFEVVVISVDEFKSPENEKIRFICKTDGILVGGEDLLRHEKETGKSYKTVWFLNKDYKERILKAKAWASAQTDIEPNEQYANVMRDVAKRTFRLGFGQVMGNYVVYATSYKDIRYLMNFYTPENKEVTNRLYHIITHKLQVDKEGLLGAIDNLERIFFPLYDAIDKGVNGIKPSSELLKQLDLTVGGVKAKTGTFVNQNSKNIK